ncbi:helix-turn-helix domain-containing protein [Streptomyces sp. NPDC006175]|uniref:helix-turn-helix domain-containing protein n=1 Tax=Streptomyces sp. NPDC006175 TaxID=3154471 RepID=UPI0033A152EA
MSTRGAGGGNKLLAAQRLGISRTTICRKMRTHTITLPSPRDPSRRREVTDRKSGVLSGSPVP